jgi:hypothetical protein
MSNTGRNCTPVEGVNITNKTETVTIRERTEVNDFKVAAMKDFLDILGDEDVDTMFMSMMATGKNLGYNLKAEPEELLAAINKGFTGEQETVHTCG